MGAPIGNHNAAKSKQWMAAIERALERRGNPDLDLDSPIERSPKMKALDDMAARFLETVEKEGITGFRELGDRLDGKASQTLEHKGDLVVHIESSDANL